MSDAVTEAFDRTNLSRAANWLGHDLFVTHSDDKAEDDIIYHVAYSKKDALTYVKADLHTFALVPREARLASVQELVRSLIDAETGIELMAVAAAIGTNTHLPCHLVDGPLAGKHINVPRDDFGKPKKNVRLPVPSGVKFREVKATGDTLEELLSSIFKALDDEPPTAATEDTVARYKRGNVDGDSLEWEYHFVE